MLHICALQIMAQVKSISSKFLIFSWNLLIVRLQTRDVLALLVMFCFYLMENLTSVLWTLVNQL